MKNQTSASRVSFIRSRAIALRVVSFASIGAPAAVSTAAPADTLPALSSPSSVPPVKSAHVWRKTAQDDAGEALPVGHIPVEVAPFVPAVSPEMQAEIAPIAYEAALPEIGSHNLAHAVNCMLIALPWHG